MKKDDLDIVLVRLMYQRLLYRLKTGFALDLGKFPTPLNIRAAFQPSGNQDIWFLFPALPAIHPVPLRSSPRLRFGWANLLSSHIVLCEQYDMNNLGRGD